MGGLLSIRSVKLIVNAAWTMRALRRDVALDGRFPCAGVGVGHDAGDERAVEPGRRVGEAEAEHLGVEPTRQRRGRRLVGEIGVAARSSQRAQQQL